MVVAIDSTTEILKDFDWLELITVRFEGVCWKISFRSHMRWANAP